MPRKPKAPKTPPAPPAVVTQDEKIVEAFVAGTLPEDDRRETERRAPEVEPQPDAPHAVAPVPSAAPYTGRRFRIHDPANPNRLRWADESGDMLPEG